MSRPPVHTRAGFRASLLLLPMLVAAGCARVDEFPPHDCTAEYEAFLKDYNAQVIKEAKATRPNPTRQSSKKCRRVIWARARSSCRFNSISRSFIAALLAGDIRSENASDSFDDMQGE